MLRAPGNLRSRRPARRARLTALALAAASAVSLATALPAAAHDELLGSSPEDGQVLDAAPEQVELAFSDDVIELGTVIELVDHHGQRVEIGETVVLGPDVTAELPPRLEGDYQVRWHAVSSDGHPTVGTIDFGVGDGATGVWASEAPPEGSESGEDEPTEASDDAGGSAIAEWTIAGLFVLGFVVVMILLRRAGGPGDAGGLGGF
jgi:methionine-rich copper-binding protein CopC